MYLGSITEKDGANDEISYRKFSTSLFGNFQAYAIFEN